MSKIDKLRNAMYSTLIDLDSMLIRINQIFGALDNELNKTKKRKKKNV